MEVLQDLWTGAGLNAIEGPGVYYTHPHHLRDGHAILLALAARFRQDKDPIAGIKEFDAGSFEIFTKSAPHLSFLLVSLGGFAADYFRGHPSALRAAGLSGARCG